MTCLPVSLRTEQQSCWCLQVLAYVNRVRDVVSEVDHATFTQADVESNDVRCPDSKAAKEMYEGNADVPGKF